MDLDSERSREEWGNIKVSGKARAHAQPPLPTLSLTVLSEI